MKYILSLTFILFSINSTFSQTYEGHSINKDYHCLLRINPDNTVNYIYDRNGNGIYAEYVGQITKLTDSTHCLKAKLVIGQYYMKSFNKDTLYIQMNPKIARQLDKIQVEYANKKTRKQFQGYDRTSKPIDIVKMPIKTELFNKKNGTDYVTVTVNRKNRITGEWVSFKIPFGSAASITTGNEIEFEISINNDIVKSLGAELTQTGHIKLEKITTHNNGYN